MQFDLFPAISPWPGVVLWCFLDGMTHSELSFAVCERVGGEWGGLINEGTTVGGRSAG